MAMLKREGIVHAERKREEVEIAALGGSVAVVQMGLVTRLAAESVASKQDRDSPAAVYATVPHVLAGCVLDADGAPLMTAEQWSQFGISNRNEVIQLFNTAMRLSGISEDAEKN